MKQQRYQRHHETRGEFGSRFPHESAPAEKGRTTARPRTAAKFQRLVGEPAGAALSQPLVSGDTDEGQWLPLHSYQWQNRSIDCTGWHFRWHSAKSDAKNATRRANTVD